MEIEGRDCQPLLRATLEMLSVHVHTSMIFEVGHDDCGNVYLRSLPKKDTSSRSSGSGQTIGAPLPAGRMLPGARPVGPQPNGPRQSGARLMGSSGGTPVKWRRL